MTARVLVAALLVASCEPRLPGAMSGVRVTVRGEGVEPGVVFVRFEPDESMPVAWALDASGGLPASRTLWTRRSGALTVVAAAFDCPSSCRDVDPWASLPQASGSASVELRLERTVSVTVHLEPRTCGNGTVEPGEACDGGPGCGDDCRMPLVEQGEYPGGPDGGIEAIPAGDGFAVAWIDGSCGAGGCSCLSWMQWTDAGADEGGLDVGTTTCTLADGAGTALGWIDVTDPASPALASLASWPPAGPVALGPTDDAVMASPAVHGPAAGLPVLGLAVEPEVGELELRWLEPGPVVASTSAAPLSGGEVVAAPAIALAHTGADTGLAALWVVGARPFLRRWSIDSSTGPAPLETSPVGLGVSWGGPAGPVLLPSPDPGRLAILTSMDGSIEIRTFPFDGAVPPEPEAVAAGAIEPGGFIADAATDGDRGILVLVVAPISGSPDCVTRLLVLDPDRAWIHSRLASWGDGGGLGCDAALALVPGARYAVAWRTPGSGPDRVLIHWSLGTTELGF